MFGGTATEHEERRSLTKSNKLEAITTISALHGSQTTECNVCSGVAFAFAVATTAAVDDTHTRTLKLQNAYYYTIYVIIYRRYSSKRRSRRNEKWNGRTKEKNRISFSI